MHATVDKSKGRASANAGETDSSLLIDALRASIEGEVRFDTGSRALYSTDSSNYRQVPIGVVVPRTVEDVIATIALCHRHSVPILSRGGGTSLAGQCCNVAVVIDFSKYLNQVLEIDADRKLARVEPGTILDDLRDAAERFHLTFGPDPATHDRCTLGGMIGNNSCGVHSVMAGKTDDNIESLDILTYDGLRLRVGATSDDELAQIIAEGGRRGEIYAALRDLRDKYADLIRERFPDIPRRVSGYGLQQLLPENGFNVARALVGTEGTCVTVLEATTRLVASPPARSLLVLGYPDPFAAADHVPEILTHKPVGLEGMGRELIDDMALKNLLPEDVALLPAGGGWLLVEFGDQTMDAANDQARSTMDALREADHLPEMKLFDDPAQAARIWAVREAGLGATANVPGQAPRWAGWEDSAVPPAKLGDYLRDLHALSDRYDYRCHFYGHFGQGCIHVRFDFDLETADGIRKFRSFLDDATDLVVKYGGSISGEHGDGQARAALLPKMYGEELVQAFAGFKAIWDPDNRMNPGKVVAPNQPDENLRLGVDYNPAPLPPNSHFSFADDNGSFAQASLRCVGVGKCRRLDGGTMCPSFMVTREEEHSTRGRARLLFELLEGDPLEGGWQDEHVKDALDLCLACKGCKGECPVQVDMATYKAEFLSHYYHGRLRPITAYTMGLIFWWARLAAHAPGLVNLATQTPGVRDVVKRLGGIAPERAIPAFAAQTFTDWFHSRPAPAAGTVKPPVLLWPDTFNNHFHPETAKAAVEVLEAAGFQVILPETWVCCGRPLYDYGMLDLAEKRLQHTLKVLRPHIRAGTPVVGLEPSCLAVFRDELHNLFPNDEDAKRLYRQSFLLGEFLERYAPDFHLPKLDRKALVHGHCHHKAIMKMDAEVAMLTKIGVDYEVVDSGCCGMAGAFGFERGEHFDVAVKAGERVLLPAVRNAAPETVIVADGFSCREQIDQLTDRRALHPAQVMQMALRGGTQTANAYSERDYLSEPATATRSTIAAVLAVVAMVVAAAIAACAGIRRST
ncbi:MAG: FAD-binding and (Fe-S)-binding domain-containing protein [Thermomicrobiales bacterium]